MEAETKVSSKENEPIFYNPKTLNLVSSVSNVLSWFVLVAFLGDVVAQFVNIRNTLVQQGMGFDAKLFSEPSALSFLISNLTTPLFTGLTLFLVLQGVAIGLNVLLEIDMKTRADEAEEIEEAETTEAV